MENASKVVLLSLKQDLLRLNDIVNEIPKNSDKKLEISSWFFPSKNYGYVEKFIRTQKVLDNGNEKLILELIIDRLYVGIKLILNALDDSSLKKTIIRPSHVTLGYCFQTLYQKIMQIKDMEIDKAIPKINEGKTIFINHKECQTDVVSLNKCDSCASAITCMKQLMNVFDNEETIRIFQGIAMI